MLLYYPRCTFSEIQKLSKTSTFTATQKHIEHLDEYIHLDLGSLGKLGDGPGVSLVERKQHRHLESRRLQRVPARVGLALNSQHDNNKDLEGAISERIVLDWYMDGSLDGVKYRL